MYGENIAKQIADRFPQAKEADDECAKIGQNDWENLVL